MTDKVKNALAVLKAKREGTYVPENDEPITVQYPTARQVAEKIVNTTTMSSMRTELRKLI
jgi:hypothetical protein